jgi:hypothetical protein
VAIAFPVKVTFDAASLAALTRLGNEVAALRQDLAARGGMTKENEATVDARLKEALARLRNLNPDLNLGQ